MSDVGDTGTYGGGTYGKWGIARTYALVFGIAYLAVALLELIVGRDGWRVGGTAILELTPAQNAIHWVVGLVVLGSFFAGEAAARTVARIIGIVFVVITVWGFIDRDGLGDLLGFDGPLPISYNIVHLATAILALIAGFASSPGGYGYGRRTATT